MSFDPATTRLRLQTILELVKRGNGAEALPLISGLASELRLSGIEDETGAGGVPAPWRLIAAYLKTAEVQIQETHTSPAEDSIEKAIYVATHGGATMTDSQLNV